MRVDVYGIAARGAVFVLRVFTRVVSLTFWVSVCSVANVGWRWCDSVAASPLQTPALAMKRGPSYLPALSHGSGCGSPIAGEAALNNSIQFSKYGSWEGKGGRR